jgi:TolB-like protein/DNA-binding SARP family transcriptional activator/Flp pilus assembly protein TadD
MFQLKLFGVPALERDGAEVSGRASQRHKLALLALLALTPGRRLTRDKLIAYLWPESDPERGRNLLKVSSYVIRSALGEDALVSSGDELRLNTDLIQVDVAEFENALERSDHERAVSLYQGPLLDGFFLPEAPEFEHWVDRERDRISGGYRKALERLAESAANTGDLSKAVEWWKLRAAQDAYDSRVALRLMQALDASGNRAGALQHAGIHQRLLQAEFGMELSPDILALVERLRVPDRGSRIKDQDSGTADRGSGIADRGPADALVLVARDEPRTALDAFTTHVPEVHRSKKLRKRWVASVVPLSALVLAGAMWAVWPRGSDQPQSIVVLPFVNLSGNQDNEYFSDGLTEEIITRLASVPGLKVISRTSAMHYKGSKKPLPEIASELKVDHILEGSVRSSDGRVRISAQLIDARQDGHIWAENFEHKVQDSFRLQEDIARDVVRGLELKLPARTRRLIRRQGTRDAQAYELFQRGRYAWNTRTREGHERAITYYQRAIERDSGYADAYAGISNAYNTSYMLNLTTLPEAEIYARLKWASERALALADESADAHVSAAVSLLWQHDWPGAEREFLRAIELNPGNATAHSWYSLTLRGMGRSQEALRESRLGAELDPFGIVPVHNYAAQCYHVRDYVCAIEQFRRTLEIGQYPSAYRWLALTNVQLGKWQEAIAQAQKAIELAPERPDFLAGLAYVYARAGQTDEARATLRRAKTKPFEGFDIARAHVALGEADSAFVWLERSSWQWGHRASRLDPALDPVRSDPRFARLVAKVDREMGLK